MSKHDDSPPPAKAAAAQCPFHHAKPVDCDAIVQELARCGALNDYPNPLGKTNVRDAMPNKDWAHNARYPGDKSYGNGPAALFYDYPITQDMVSAQRQSFKDAINAMMPQDTMDAWMRSYFDGDFLRSDSLKALIGKARISHDPTDKLETSLSFDLDNPGRKRTDRKLFTAEEVQFTGRLCKAQPGVAMAVLAYQASFIDYLREIKKAAEKAEIEPDRKERILTVARELEENWTTSGNFENFILPAIAVAYHKNHGGGVKEPPTLKDFQEGMAFVFEKGAFENVVPGRDKEGTPIKFSCPAKGILMRSSACELDAGGAESPHGGMMRNAGRIFFDVYRKIEQEIDQEKWVTHQLRRDLFNSLMRSEDPKFQDI